MQETWAPSLVQQDPTGRGATKPVRHNYQACALEPEDTTTKPTCHSCRSLLCGTGRAPSKRSLRTATREQPPLATTTESWYSNEDLAPKIRFPKRTKGLLEQSHAHLFTRLWLPSH